MHSSLRQDSPVSMKAAPEHLTDALLLLFYSMAFMVRPSEREKSQPASETHLVILQVRKNNCPRVVLARCAMNDGESVTLKMRSGREKNDVSTFLIAHNF